MNNDAQVSIYDDPAIVALWQSIKQQLCEGSSVCIRSRTHNKCGGCCETLLFAVIHITGPSPVSDQIDFAGIKSSVEIELRGKLWPSDIWAPSRLRETLSQICPRWLRAETVALLSETDPVPASMEQS